MSEQSKHGNVFGVSISAGDIYLEEDGTVKIANQELVNKIKQVQSKTVEALMNTSTRGDINFTICL